MKVFNPRHFLRHISMPTLREFMAAQALASRLNVDWGAPEPQLPDLVCDGIQALEESLPAANMNDEERRVLQGELFEWLDDLRRVHLMSDELAIRELLLASANDQAVVDAFADRDAREQAMWMFTNREQAFRDVELQLAFLAKANGKYWKKHRIDAGLNVPSDRAGLEALSNSVANLYKKVGGGKSTHVEYSRHASNGRIQLTIYVEGPVTAVAHFTNNHFERLAARIALETALVYDPANGHIETVVKGGGRNHAALLQLFGQHVVGQAIKPELVEKTRYRLNVLRDGIQDPIEDLSPLGVEKIRLRRVHLTARDTPGATIRIEASPEVDQPDAINVARDTLRTAQRFEIDYDLDGATMIVHMGATNGRKGRHFSFDLYASGSSTIGNLTQRDQPVAWAVLRGLQVVDDDGAE